MADQNKSKGCYKLNRRSKLVDARLFCILSEFEICTIMGRLFKETLDLFTFSQGDIQGWFKMKPHIGEKRCHFHTTKFFLCERLHFFVNIS